MQLQQQIIDHSNNDNRYGKTDISQLREFTVGSGSQVIFMDKEGSRWGHHQFDFAQAYIKTDGSYKFKSGAGDVLIDSNNGGGDYINVINNALNTSSKTILTDFTFEATDYKGAFKTGNITWSEVTGLPTAGTGGVFNSKGLIFAKDGTPTITLNGETGDATFGGTLSAASGTLGTITSGTITGATVQTNSTGYRLRMSSNNRFESLNGETVLGYINTDATGDIRIAGADDIHLNTGGADRVGIYNGRLAPFSNDSYDIGDSSHRFDNGYIRTLRSVELKIGSWTFKLRSGSADLELDYGGCVKTRWETDGDLKQQRDVKWGWGVELPTC